MGDTPRYRAALKMSARTRCCGICIYSEKNGLAMNGIPVSVYYQCFYGKKSGRIVKPHNVCDSFKREKLDTEAYQ